MYMYAYLVNSISFFIILCPDALYIHYWARIYFPMVTVLQLHKGTELNKLSAPSM
jgi:hypothetical protein